MSIDANEQNQLDILAPLCAAVVTTRAELDPADPIRQAFARDPQALDPVPDPGVVEVLGLTVLAGDVRPWLVALRAALVQAGIIAP